MPTPLPKLAAPARRALAAAGVETLERLERHTEAEIAAMHGMGPNAMKSLRDVMSAAGIRFKPAA